MNSEINHHLKEAYQHLQAALDISIQDVKNNKSEEKPIGQVWESFLGDFFRSLRVKGKENKLNLLSFVSFTKLLKG
ncbi:MAG: hypothetical protein ACXVDE_09250 [Tumebacillaceae bacterium]